MIDPHVIYHFVVIMQCADCLCKVEFHYFHWHTALSHGTNYLAFPIEFYPRLFTSFLVWRYKVTFKSNSKHERSRLVIAYYLTWIYCVKNADVIISISMHSMLILVFADVVLQPSCSLLNLNPSERGIWALVSTLDFHTALVLQRQQAQTPFNSCHHNWKLGEIKF